jgi:diguanylate cyclase (GGDEF)-like protein
MLSVSTFDLNGESCIHIVMRDISKARMDEQEIRTLAFYDQLTGLANRRLLQEQLHLRIDADGGNGRKHALFFIDLDNFKNLNDASGHQRGDLMLQEVARRLVACVRNVDVVGRLGGDEFVLILEHLGDLPEEMVDQAKNMAEKILARLSEPYLIEGVEYHGSCSIGITIFGGSHVSATEALKQADIAMYQAKAAGRNTAHFFAPELQSIVNSRAVLVDELRQGVKTSQFALYFQPQFDHKGHCLGAEALLRWKHPTRGLLAPYDFISVAEESRMILPLGSWVLEEACRQLARWATDGQTSKIMLAVNISVVQFRSHDFVEGVLRSLDRAGANPRNLKLEITESTLVDDIEDVIAKMMFLKAHGVRISLDDFGTGYSSLAYLNRLPLDELKIDSSFVRNAGTEPTSGAIVETIVSLGRTMGLSVIAEGVETEEQRSFLANLGCRSFQGFLLSHPLPVGDFERLLRDSQVDALLPPA